jgi:hypothetical protein
LSTMALVGCVAFVAFLAGSNAVILSPFPCGRDLGDMSE